MKINVNGGSGSIEIADTAFSVDFNEPLVHQVITAFLSGGRAGTKAQKNRSEASGGGAKPWRQKGTGRARAGTIRSPIWVGGGRTFAAKPRNFSQKINRKMYRGAMRSMLSELIRQNRLFIVNSIDIKNSKTRDLAKILKKHNLESVLIIIENYDENIFLASRNLSNVSVCDVKSMNPVALIRYEKVLVTIKSIKMIEEYLI
jgi:large subunit ribosomal protein L4|tara:strand:- start:92 stop:697 length:606 start_codon:yes stop_codon:yes gene_type:complete